MPNEQDSQRGNPSRGATQAARDIGQAAVETFHEYSEQATQTYEQSREQVNQWIGDLRQRATDEPVKTVLMAAGVGVVLGVLFG